MLFPSWSSSTDPRDLKDGQLIVKQAIKRAASEKYVLRYPKQKMVADSEWNVSTTQEWECL